MKRNIHWCMECNLLTISKRCPLCKKEVSRLDLDLNGRLSPVSPKDADTIRSSVDSLFGEGCGELLMPDGCVAFLDMTPTKTDIIVNGGIVGLIIGDTVTLNASGLRAILPLVKKNIVKCDHDSSFFVKKGRNLMVTGITDISPDLKEGDRVAVLDDKGAAIASGIMKMSSEAVRSSERGVAVGIRSTDSPRTCYGVKHRGWKDTLDANILSIQAQAGISAKNIATFASSYGREIIVRFDGGIRSEVSLLLVMDAGYRPKVIVDRRNEFVDYFLKNHDLETIEEIPQECILITERYDGGFAPAGIIAHSPISDWEPSMLWVYIMFKKEPFCK